MSYELIQSLLLLEMRFMGSLRKHSNLVPFNFSHFLDIFEVNNEYMVVNFSSKDVLMRVVAQNLSPQLTLVEKVSS